MTPDDDDTLTWRIEPTCGTLAPGSEHIITCWFAPTSSRTYELPVGVFLDDDTTTPYLEWMVTGEGMHPQLTFDREQVILPVVPLGVKSSTTFQILNQGYENLELKYTIQGNSSVLGSSETATSTDARLPLTITFPEGSTLGMGRNIIPVTISFLAKKSISFITRITFYGVGQGQDDVPNRFHIDVTGTSDNSLITTQSWIDTYHKNNAMEWHIHETKPIMVTAKQMVTIESARDDIDTERAIFSPDGHDIDDTVSSMGGFPTTTIVNEHRLTPPLAHISNRMHPDAIYDRTLDAVLSYLRASHLLHAVASHWDRPATGTLDTPASPSRSSRLDASSIVNMSVDSFPQEILASHGRVVRDLIRIISGHAVTDPNAPPQRTITHPSNQQPSKNDLTMSLYKEYIILLNHMKGHGALLGAIRPEHCLSLAQYLRLLSIPTYQQEQKDILPTSTTEWTRYHQTIERTFASISRHTWLTILLQIIKIYILPRINMTSFKSLSGLSPELPIMSWNHSGSNIYSTSESILLSWLTHHWNKYNPLEPRRITRFDTDLADGSVLAGVLLSHVPSLTILHKWSKTSDRIENVTRLMQALRILGITYRLKPHTLLEPNARDLMLFVMYLYQNLPNYIPKTVIEFKGRLHDDITKSIELSNPHSKKSLVYTVRIDGASEYTIDRAHITLAPRGKDGSVQRFPIRFHAKFSATAEARVIFTSEEESNVHGSTLVFLLRSVITSRQPTRVIDDITTSCYEARDVDVRLHNPFASDGVFQVILKMDREPEAPRVKTAPETRKQSVVMSRTSSALGVPRVTSTSTSTSTSNKNDPNFMFPPAFFTKHEKIKLKANTDTTITVQFLPWRVGTYKWQLILLDENLGEFMYALHGNSTLPRALESISLKGSLTLPLQHTLQVSLRNPHIEHARSITVDRIRTLSRSQRESKRARPDWVYQMLKIDLITSPMTYTITSTSPFFTGPNHVTIVEQKGNEKDKRISGRASVFANPLSPFRSQSALSQVMTIDDTTNRIPITFTSRGPGLYATDIVLTSVWDTRVCHIECMVSAQESEPIMEFHVPARQTVSQNIPIVNNSNDTWHIKASITGKHFSGPQDIIIPPKSTSSYTLSFTPPWLCDITGQLELMNMRTADVMTYTLHGVGDEPLAVAHIHREVQARSICEIEIAVANASNTDCLYTIETDMEGWEGASTIRVPANGSELYRLKIKPQLSGLMQGHISFIAPDKKYQWYAIELIVTAPAPEATLVLKTALRSVMRKSIELRNDEDDECTWDVEVAGPGISGPSVFIIPPNTTGSYTFEYRPLTAGISHGTLSFSHPQRGQYFYLLELHGESNAPIKIPNMTCTLGTAVTYPITIENPLDETIVLRSHSSNTRNFVIQPSSITISPFGTAEAHIRYTPSSIDVQQTGELSLEHPLAGRWVYLCTGMGMAPNTMKETIVACPLKQQCSGHVSFRNPFDEMMKVKIELKDTTGTFQLFSKKPHLTLAPFAIHQLAFFFTPHLMRDHDATIIVESMDRERILTWIYPIKGVAEGAVSTSSLDFHTRSRTLLDTTASLPLTGLSHGMLSSPEQFTIELESSQKWENFLARALKIELINDTITHGDESLQIRVKWHPFRPVRIKATLIAVKRSGGRWCFPITLDASEAAPDDTIRMECAAHGSSHITFPLINPGPPSPFQAYFAYDSNPSFSVWPKQGMLDTQGTEFRVTFTPKEYGKERTAKLIVETEHMQWSYMLHGTHPRYEIPAVTAPTIDNKLPSVLKTSTISSTPKNYITTNKKKTTVHGMNSPSSQKRK